MKFFTIMASFQLTKAGRFPMELSEQESQLIEVLREQAEKDDFRLLIELQDGAWDITLTVNPKTKSGGSARGMGPSFGQAWDAMYPPWA